MAAPRDDADAAIPQVDRALSGAWHQDGLLQCRGARVVGRLIPLKHEVARTLGRAHRRLSVRTVRREVAGHAVRVVGVIVRDDDVRWPAARELTGFRAEPGSACRLVESLDRDDTRAASDDTAVRECRAIAA
jgi:hypothetical protein